MVSEVEEETIVDRDVPALSNKAHMFEFRVKYIQLHLKLFYLGMRTGFILLLGTQILAVYSFFLLLPTIQSQYGEPDPVRSMGIYGEDGEISAQKGSTSATGSMGGFWIGLWVTGW